MYIEIHNDSDIDKVKEILTEADIEVYDIFDNMYEKMCEENVRYYLHEIILNDGGYIHDSELENNFLENVDELFDKTIDKSKQLMYDNEYLSEIIGECTIEAIEGGLRELFIKVEESVE